MRPLLRVCSTLVPNLLALTACWGPEAIDPPTFVPALRQWDADHDGDLDLSPTYSRAWLDGLFFRRDGAASHLSLQRLGNDRIFVFSTMDGIADPIALEKRSGTPDFPATVRVHRGAVATDLQYVEDNRGKLAGARPSRARVDDTIVLSAFRSKDADEGFLDVYSIPGHASGSQSEPQMGESLRVALGDLGRCEIASGGGYVAGATKDYFVLNLVYSFEIPVCIVEYEESTQGIEVHPLRLGEILQLGDDARSYVGAVHPCLRDTGQPTDDCLLLHSAWLPEDAKEYTYLLQLMVKRDGKWQAEGTPLFVDEPFREVAYAHVRSPSAFEPVLLGSRDVLVLSLDQGVSVQDRLSGIAGGQLGFIDMDGDGLDDLAGYTNDRKTPMTYLNKSGTFVRQ